MKPVRFLVVLILYLVIVAACSSDEREAGATDAAFLTEMAAWFKRFDEHVFPLYNNREKNLALWQELADIRPPNVRSWDHAVLLNAYALKINIEELVRTLEPIEQAHWRYQGADAVAACINLGFDQSLLTYLSDEFYFACSVQYEATKLWSNVYMKWRIIILDEFGDDPYGMRN